MKKKVGFVSLGCPKNLIDSEVMLGRLSQAGYEIVQKPDEAELLVVNTCGFIEAAKQESIDTILEMADYKKTGKLQKLVVSGCLAQRYASELSAELPEVDAIVGLDSVDAIVENCEKDERFVETMSADASAEFLYDHISPRVLTTAGHTAYLKISEGCDYPCTFCIIPKIRGHYRSRTPESILREAEALASRGVRELVLIAQDTTRYGVELGLRRGLSDLLRQLAQVDGIEWIRFLYAYPTTVHPSLMEVIASEDKVCRYLDMPLQHGSDRVLKAMKRPGTRESNLAMIRRIREAVPGVAVRSSFIVGFPGETERDFSELMDFCAQADFDHLGVFTYSNETDTEAFVQIETATEDVKQARKDALMEQQMASVGKKNRSRVGETIRVLVDGLSDETELLLQGRSEWQAPEIDSCVLINDGQATAGEFVDIEITEAHPYDLVGRIVEREPRTEADSKAMTSPVPGHPV